MGDVFNTQTYLRIELSYTADVASDIDSVKIKYTNPNDTSGEWNATHDTVNKKVYYDLEAGSPLAVYGRWHFWIYATMTDGRVLIGEVANTLIEEEGVDKQ